MAPNPGYTELDRTTGLHMTGSPQTIDLATYRLKVTGLVDHPLSLSYDDLRCMPKVTASPLLVCPGVFEDEATWSGVPLSYVLGLAGVQREAKWIAIVAADNYSTHMELKDALEDGNFLAYEWDGKPLPVLHGFPVRAVFSSMPGGRWVKWLLEIRVEQSSGSMGVPGSSK
jgi:DMSO/TMAO reductase YedYZ molybdopterin-dependent catalytic subunit